MSSGALTSASVPQAGLRRDKSGSVPQAGVRRDGPTPSAKGRDWLEARGPARAIPDGPQPPEWIMWMPAGRHAITASKAGEPVTVTVEVDRQTAEAAQAALEAHLATPQKPWFDFDHDRTLASAHPLEFAWRDEPRPGVYARVEWTRPGAEAITGRSYRAFSPAFWVDDERATPARVTGAPLDMGGLVNDPAFKDILPLWARRGSNEGDTTMTPEELAALQAKQRKLEEENAELKAKAASSDQTIAIKAKDAEIQTLTERIKHQEGIIQARRKADAQAAVEAAVARGALPPKDEALQAKWRGLVEADPGNAELLAKLPANPALTPVTQPDGEGHLAARSGGVVITREDTRKVLAAYLEAKSPRAAGNIYKLDIAPRLAKDEPLDLRGIGEGKSAIEAANSLGTLAGSLVLQRALELLRFELPVLNRISTDLSDAPAKFNQTVNVQKITPPAVTDYNTSTGYASSDIAVADVPVVINKHKAVQVKVTVEDLASTTRALLDEQAAPMAYALGADVAGALWALILNANFSNKTTVSASNFNRTYVIAVGTALTGRKVPKFKRTLILNPTYYGKLAEDTTVVAVATNPDAVRAITTGKLPDLHGFALSEQGTLTDNSENLTGAGFAPAALALAARVPADYTQVFPGATAGARVQTVTDPDTGLSLMQVQFIDHKLGAAYSRAAWMYGVAKGDTDQLQRIVSA